jgi:hypothetical protein
MYSDQQRITNDIPSGPRAINVKKILFSFSIFLASCAWSVLYFRHWSKKQQSILRTFIVRCDLDSNKERGIKYFVKVQLICLCTALHSRGHTSDKTYILSKINYSTESLVMTTFLKCITFNGHLWGFLIWQT